MNIKKIFSTAMVVVLNLSIVWQSFASTVVWNTTRWDNSLNSTAAMLDYPDFIKVDTAWNLYVSDNNNNKIKRYNSLGERTLTIWDWTWWSDNDLDWVNAKFYSPAGISVDGSWNIYVADAYNRKIKKFDSNGNRILSMTIWDAVTWDTNLSLTGARFQNIRGLSLDSIGNIYVTDEWSTKIKKYDPNGTWLMTLGNSIWGSTENNLNGTSAKIWTPRDVFVDWSGSIYITNFWHRVRKYDSAGNWVMNIWSVQGDNNLSWTSAQLNDPRWVVVDNAWNIYVASRWSNKVQIYDSNGNWLKSFLSTTPNGLAVDQNWYVFVSTNNSMVKKFILENDWPNTLGYTVLSTNPLDGRPTITLTSQDQADIYSYYYCVDTDDTCSPTTPLAVWASFIVPLWHNFVRFKAMDNLQNESVISSNEFNIVDNVLPSSPTSLILNYNESTTSNTTLLLTTLQHPNESDVAWWLVSESFVPPNANDPEWTVQKPTTYTLQNLFEWFKNIYVYVKDAAWNVQSMSASDTITYNSIDVTPPTKPTNFVLLWGDTSTNTQTVAITTLAHTNQSDVAWWMIKENSTVPNSGDAWWVAQKPTTYTFTNNNTETKHVYVFVKDSVWNVQPEYLSYEISLDVNTINSTIIGNTSRDTEENWLSAWLSSPKWIYVDSLGNIYIADSGNNKIKKYDSTGTWLMTIGDFPGDTNGSWYGAELTIPTKVKVDSLGNIYVADSENSKVKKYDSTGTWMLTIGDGSWNDNELDWESASLWYTAWVAVDSDFNIYITDGMNYKVKKYDSTGHWLLTIGSTPWDNELNASNAQMWFPIDVATDSSNNVYILDQEGSKIKKYDSNGTWLMTLWSTSWNNNLSWTNAQFVSPSGLSVDWSWNIYVSDTSGHMIKKYDSTGTWLYNIWNWTFGHNNLLGSKAKLSWPEWVAVDTAWNVYVADTWNHKIKKFLFDNTAPNNVSINNTSWIDVDWVIYGTGNIEGTFSSQDTSWVSTYLYCNDTDNSCVPNNESLWFVAYNTWTTYVRVSSVDVYMNKSSVVYKTFIIDTDAPNSLSFSWTKPSDQGLSYTWLILNSNEVLNQSMVWQSGSSLKWWTYEIISISGSTVEINYTSPTWLNWTDQDKTDTININLIDIVWNQSTIGVDTDVLSAPADSIPPTATVEYDNTNPTNWDVIATLTGASESITVNNNGGLFTKTFTSNGTFTFEFSDLAGNTWSVLAEVSNIDKTAPTATVEYDISTLTNGSVTATLTWSSEAISITSSWGSTHVFNENGIFDFTFTDSVGNTWSVSATVNNIDSTAPTAIVIYDNLNPTNQDVISTLTGASKEITITNNGGLSTHTFTENGSFEYQFIDNAWNTWSVLSEVSNIDKTSPTATVEYNNTNPTNQNVIVTLTWSSEDITIVNNGGSGSYEFASNGSFTFDFIDNAGNTWSVLAEVSNIDKTSPTVSVLYDNVNPTNTNVIATLTWSSEPITVTNNSGSLSYEFTENGLFTFEFTDSVGNTSTLEATVSNIDKTSPTASVIYDNTNLTNSWVVSTLTGSSEPITIINNWGNTDRIFVDNGTFEYQFIDASGNTWSVVVTVNNIVLDYNGPIISNFAIIPTIDSADVSFTYSDSNASNWTGEIRFGTWFAYENIMPLTTFSNGTGSIVLNSLESNTTYNVKVITYDNFLNKTETVSSFKTLKIALVLNWSNLTETGSTILTGSTVQDWGTLNLNNTNVIIESDLNDTWSLTWSLSLSGITFLTVSWASWNWTLIPPFIATGSGTATLGELVSSLWNSLSWTNIVETVKVGAEWTSIIASGSTFTVSFHTSMPNGSKLDIYRSEDWSSWVVNNPDSFAIVDISWDVTFRTDRLSFFTVVSDSTPDAFTLSAVSGATPSTEYTASFTVSGTNTWSSIQIDWNGTYKINTWSFVSTSWTVQPWDTITVKVVSSSSYSTAKSTTITVGWVSSIFTVSNKDQPVSSGGGGGWSSISTDYCPNWDKSNSYYDGKCELALSIVSNTWSTTIPTSNNSNDSTVVNTALPNTSTTNQVKAIKFSDIDGSFAKEYINLLVSLGVVKGYSDGTFRPDNNVTRAEFLSMIMKKEKISINETSTTFEDVPDAWLSVIATAEKQWYIKGQYVNGKKIARPNDSITRAEAIKILLSVKKTQLSTSIENEFDDVSEEWMIPYISTAKLLWIISWQSISGKLKFRPNDSITRAESAKIILK